MRSQEGKRQVKVVTSAAEMSRLAREARGAGKRIAFVPTMGALHEGHLALFREGRRRGDLLAVSIFVNPRQFNDPTDYEKYPRDLEGDLRKCREEGVDVVFVPAEKEIYPPGQAIEEISLPAVAGPLEGRSRPGHFAGVVAVVTRLFRIVQPHVAIFGQKDFQQLRVIEEVVRARRWGIRILPHPIVRTPGGLAVSSRNARLTPAGLKQALVLSRSLRRAVALFSSGERNPKKIREAVLEEFSGEKSLRIDYAAIVDAASLQEVPVIDRPVLVALAAFVAGVRLIDNCLLDLTQLKKATS